MLVNQEALSLQLQLVLEETLKEELPRPAPMLREVGFNTRVSAAPAWVRVWVRVKARVNSWC